MCSVGSAGLERSVDRSGRSFRTEQPRICEIPLADACHALARAHCPCPSLHTPLPGSRARSALALSAIVTRFCRGTSTPRWQTFRRFGRGSAQKLRSRDRDLASDFASLQFSKRPAENTKAALRRLVSDLDWRGRWGLDPATSGVTARGRGYLRSRVFREGRSRGRGSRVEQSNPGRNPDFSRSRAPST